MSGNLWRLSGAFFNFGAQHTDPQSRVFSKKSQDKTAAICKNVVMDNHLYQKKIQRVLRHIEKNLDALPSLDELAEVAHFSPFHFHRVFKSLVGESVAAYVRRLALQRAAWQVSYSQASIIGIALDAGYESPEAFTRAFRAAFGVSPSQYRKNGGSLAFSMCTDVGRYPFYHANPEVSPVDVIIKVFKPVLVASLRHVGPYDSCGPAWGRLWGLLEAAALCAPDPVAYGISYDDPDTTPAEKCRMDICFTLPDGVDSNTPALAKLLQTTELFVQHLGNGGEYACVSIKGPYSLLHPAYRSLFGEWLPQSGREPGDSPGFEAYYNDPSCTPPEELLSEIFIPLKPSA